MTTIPEIWGPQEIADYTGMRRSSVARRKWRGEQGLGGGLPPADLSPSGHDLWLAETIRKWWEEQSHKEMKETEGAA